jgi:hypothetical protein
MSDINRNPVRWDLDLSPLVNVPVLVETVDGGARRGLITKVDFREVELDGLMCPIPDRLVMDSDANDWIGVDVVHRVSKL